MTRRIKVQALEIDGVELNYPEEVLLDVSNILCTSEDFESDTLNDVLLEVKNNSIGFPWNVVPYDKTIVVPENRQMAVKGKLVIKGKLEIKGSVCLY